MDITVKKIFVIVLPDSGHVNPVAGVIHELATKKQKFGHNILRKR